MYKNSNTSGKVLEKQKLQKPLKRACIEHNAGAVMPFYDF